MSQDLSLNDVVMPKCYTRVLWVFDYRIDDLEKPLLAFLEKCCPSAFGQITYDETKPNTGRLVESSSRSTTLFSRAEQKEMSVSHYLSCSFQDTDVFPYSAIPTETSPLLFLHQISLRDGTLLAIGAHHHLCDGHGFFSLIDRFSKWISDRDESRIKPLIHDRSLLKPANGVHYEHIEYTIEPPVFAFTSMPAMNVLVRRYTKKYLFEKLNIPSKDVSFNDVLVAWLTQAISQIRQVPLNETVTVAMASDGRITLGIGEDYFGNCNFYVCVQFKMVDLAQKSVNELAEQVNVDKKQRMTREYMQSALARIQSASKPIHAGFNSFCGKDLAFTNWSRFPAYQIDFGQGPPKRIMLPAARFEGLVLILPTLTDEVELYIGLKADHADQLVTRLP